MSKNISEYSSLSNDDFLRAVGLDPANVQDISDALDIPMLGEEDESELDPEPSLKGEPETPIDLIAQSFER